MGNRSLILAILGLAFALASGSVMAQQAPPVYVVARHTNIFGCGYNAPGGPDTPWPDLSFSVGSAASGISATSAFGAAGGAIAVHVAHNGTDIWRSICTVDVYMRGDPGTAFHLEWSCTQTASATNNSPGAYATSVEFLGGACGNFGIQVLSPSLGGPGGSDQQSMTVGGIIDGTTSSTISNPAFPGVTYSFATGFTHWIQVGANTCCGQYIGSASADWDVSVTANLVHPGQTPPTAVIDPIAGASPDVAVTINGSNSHANTPGAFIIEYEWDIQKQNGADTLFGSTIQYAWDTAGTYLVTLTVTDSDGLTGTTSTSVNVEEVVQSVRLWINAFIPSIIPGLTFTAPAPFSPSTVFRGPEPLYHFLRALYFTDQRSFSSDPTASARMHSEVSLDITFGPIVLSEVERTSPTEEIGQHYPQPYFIACLKPADNSRMHFQNLRGSPDQIQIDISAAANNPCTEPFPRLPTPDINYIGTVTINVPARTISFSGFIDSFPAFEMYASINNDSPVTVFTVPPPPGHNPWNLFGPATVPVNASVPF